MLFARASRSFARALSSTPRLTKIVATIGPASEQAEPLGRCLVAGINVMRVNFSHATVDEFHLRRTNLRAAAGGELVPIMLDTKGPEIRMGGLAVCKEGGRKAKITLTAGAEVLLTTDPRRRPRPPHETRTRRAPGRLRPVPPTSWPHRGPGTTVRATRRRSSSGTLCSRQRSRRGSWCCSTTGWSRCG